MSSSPTSTATNEARSENGSKTIAAAPQRLQAEPNAKAANTSSPARHRNAIPAQNSEGRRSVGFLRSEGCISAGRSNRHPQSQLTLLGRLITLQRGHSRQGSTMSWLSVPADYTPNRLSWNDFLLAFPT